jgi:ABC-type multidrug transport system fused ATPase/permease subunit
VSEQTVEKMRKEGAGHLHRRTFRIVCRPSCWPSIASRHIPMDPTPLIDPVASMEEAHGNGAAGIGVQLRADRISVSVPVSGSRSRKVVLSRATASFEPGSFCALMGPSGAGKTTLLNALRTGRCTSGALLANGAPYTRLARRLIVTVPQVSAARRVGPALWIRKDEADHPSSHCPVPLLSPLSG